MESIILGEVNHRRSFLDPGDDACFLQDLSQQPRKARFLVDCLNNRHALLKLIVGLLQLVVTLFELGSPLFNEAFELGGSDFELSRPNSVASTNNAGNG